jgi:thymidylate synthase
MQKTKNIIRQLQHPIPSENLYQPDKYVVHVGTGSVGFCTVWNEPNSILKSAPSLHKKAALVGTLYSSYGINAIVRNLALNPFIKKLYLWGYGPLSDTKFGLVGISTIKQIWQHGVQNDGRLINSSFKLDQEIDIGVLDIVRKNVELIDLSDKNLTEAVKAITPTDLSAYMKPVRFPDAKLSTPDTFPSEQLGFAIHGSTIIDTWTRLVAHIIRYGTVKGTQYGSKQKELIGATWIVHDEDPKNPEFPSDWPKELREVTGATKDAINEYHEVFLSPKKPAGISYTYGNRLMRAPVPGKHHTIDQIAQSIIRNLKESPDSRRAIATTYIPWIDAKSQEPPCITQIQGIQSQGKFHLLVTARSHDIFKAAIPNAFGLRILQARIAKELDFKLGALQITSQSAHIYESDWDNAQKLATCAIWERPPKPLTGVDTDPRGAFKISIKNKKILVEFTSPDGLPLLQFEGKTADYIVREIGKHELFSQTTHALDIGAQLARAEMAIQLNIPFKQDKALKV